MFISIKIHCQPCASYSNRRSGIWSLAVTTVLLTLWGDLILRTDVDPVAQDQLLQWNLTFRLKVAFCHSQMYVSSFAVYITVPQPLSPPLLVKGLLGDFMF